MAAMSRRAMLTNILPGAVVAVAGVGTIGWAVAPNGADAMPLAIAKGNRVEVDDLVVKAQAVVVSPSRRAFITIVSGLRLGSSAEGVKTTRARG